MLNWESLDGQASFCLESSGQCLDLILLLVAGYTPVFLWIFNSESPEWSKERITEDYAVKIFFKVGRDRLRVLGGQTWALKYCQKSRSHNLVEYYSTTNKIRWPYSIFISQKLDYKTLSMSYHDWVKCCITKNGHGNVLLRNIYLDILDYLCV